MGNRIMAVIARTNRTAVFLASTALVLVALVVGGWFGGVVLGAIAAGMLTLLARVWPALSPGGRMTRLVLLTVLMAVAILQFRR